jgi:Ca2+-binding RTX toxin-like protein
MGAQGDAFDGQSATGQTTVFGGSGNDTIATNDQSGVVSGQQGDDSIDASGGANTVPGGDKAVSGGQGFDTVVGGGGNDFLDGAQGNDSILAGSGGDRVFGGEGNDYLAGEAGKDSLYGGTGNDTLLGGADDDMLSGSTGNDYLSGDGGNDTMFGGTGNDVFFFDSNFGNDVIRDLGNGDQIWLKADLNGSGIAKASDVKAFLQGGTDPGTGMVYTEIKIGADVIRIDGMDQATFEQQIATWVKIQP